MLNLDFFNFINTAHGQSLGGTVDAALGKQEDAYQQIQSFDGSPNQKIPFSDQNSQVDGLASQINYIVTFMMIVLIVGIILRLIYGAVQKGTSDNIFGQKKGNEMIKNAGEVLVSFILIYSVLSWINPDLTGWNVAIKALDTKITTSEKDTLGTIRQDQTASAVPGFGGGECNATSKQRTFTTEMIRVALSSNNSAGNKILLDIKDIDNNKNNAQYGFNINNRCSQSEACTSGCTTLGGMPSIVIDMLTDLLKRCNSYSSTDKCIIIISGGTEWGHYSHMPGVAAIDLSYVDNGLLNKFIKNLNPAGNSNNCMRQYSFIDGINHKSWVFCEEGSKSNSNTTGKHWHVSKSKYN